MSTCIFILAAFFFTSSFGFAQTAEKSAEAAGTNSMIGIPSAPSAPILAPPAANVIGTVPCVGIGCVPQPAIAPTAVMPLPTVMPYPNMMVPYYPPPMPSMNVWNMLSNACTTLATAAYKPPRMLKSTRSALDRYNDRTGFKRDSSFDDDDAKRAGRSLQASLSSSALACQKFINKEGLVGSWGRTTLAAMENHKEVYENHVPNDIAEYCPKFSDMSVEKRKLFWVWLFASMSAPESSCNPKAKNGGSIGLFQIDPNGCRVAGVHVNQSDLYDPHTNIRCAVARLAFEMKRRSTIIASHSRDATGTYWGVLRGDSAHPVDSHGADRTRTLLSQYSDCH